MNILLIEDTKSHSDFIISILKKNNHSVELINDGDLAFNYLLNPKVFPDVVVADNFLPSKTGLEIIEHFVKNNYNYAFIILTSGKSIDLAVKGMKVGALEYISKSVNLKEELQIIIEKAYKTNKEINLRKSLEKNLKESEDSLKRQYQNLPFPTYSWKKTKNDFILTDYNLAAIEISKGGIKKHIGTKLKKMFRNYPNIIEKVIECHNTKQNQITETYYTFQFTGITRHLKSTYVYVSSNIVMVHTEDITEQKNAELIIKENEYKLKELNATKDKFFSIIAHDLKSPFNTMLGFSELLINNFEKYDVQKQKKYLSILNSDMKNTYKLLENLLLWSQTQRGTIDFNPQKEKLYLLVTETIDILLQTAINKSITIHNKIPENTIIYADKNMLTTIIRNLVSNAIKFTKKGGTIEIGYNSNVKARHAVSQQEKTGSENMVDDPVELVELYVKDNGLGIEKDIQNQLFKITKNISTQGTENEEGTGLGLILCKEFVEKHGGEIWLESEVAKGSKFIFSLPLN